MPNLAWFGLFNKAGFLGDCGWIIQGKKKKLKYDMNQTSKPEITQNETGVETGNGDV